MSLDIGFDAQTPSLPQGGGAVARLGETFTPDLSTGTGSYRIPIDVPNGPNDIGPRLALRYSTADGNGPFGMGFSLGTLPCLLRSTSAGFPQFDATDTLVLEGAGGLVALGGGKYRPQVDGGAWRAQASGDGFLVTDRDGIDYVLGVSAGARLAGDGVGNAQVYAWHLEQISDALGNTAMFTWIRDKKQLYLSKIAYGAYEIRFAYENRPDIIRWGRAGFTIITALRCASIELHLSADAQPLLRRWTLSYTQDETNRCSLLTGVVLSGFAKDETQVDGPHLTLGYSDFQTRQLVRFKNIDEGAPPGPLTTPSRRVDLIDWNGNGLPDLIDIGNGGRARLWPNLGDCTWGRPQQLADIPLFALASAEVALADMNGDGVADLLRLDRPIDSYVPRTVEAGFERPVTFRRAPSATPGDLNDRLIDLDGDGIVDLLSSSAASLTLYYRSDPEGWSEQPQVVSRGVAPDVDLSDPHVFLADMTGDGSSDVVRVDGGGVTYWPYLGRGRWDGPVSMSNPPLLPFDVNPHRLFLTDIDGDGCADLLYLDQDRVLYWINHSGNALSDSHEIDYVPTGAIAAARLADVRGSGTAGILWSTPGVFDRSAAYFYLDFTGSSKPYLLNEIDNGVGLRTHITYSTSAQEAAADNLLGNPWSTTLPVAIPVISEIASTDSVTGRQNTARYNFHDGRYDGILREFAGFGRVDEDLLGDATSPALRTTNWFHIGVDKDNPSGRLSSDDRRRLRAIRGRIYRQERYGLDGSAQQDLPYDRVDQTWDVTTLNTPGGPVELPRLKAIVRSTIERTAGVVATMRTENVDFDENGNVTESIQTSEEVGHPERTQVLRTVTTFAADEAGRFIARVYRIQQSDGTGSLVADTIREYDGAQEGKVGTQGLLTRQTALVLTDALVADVYGDKPPDFTSLGYFRRADENGWWIAQAGYDRIEDQTGLHGRVKAPRGAVTQFDFDNNKTFPVKITDARGNVIAANHNYRVSRVEEVTDASGSRYVARFDPLARPTAVIEPGDSEGLPTHSYTYVTDALPIEATLHQRAETGKNATIDTREIFDGEGKLLERRTRDATGEIVALSNLYSSRGFLARAHQERRPTAAAYAKPDAAWPHIEYRYDAVGRQVRQENIDGSVRTYSYGPLSIDESDEEDTLPSSPHFGTATQKHLYATGRVRQIDQNLGGRLISSTYEFDVKGNLTRHTDGVGNAVMLTYDLLGRTLRAVRPEQTTISVFDADGNAVEARNGSATLVIREFDELKRPKNVRYSDPANEPVMRFTYQDAGFPAPPDAGAHTAGQLVRVDDESGSTVFDYDERGRIALKRSSPGGAGGSFELRFAYRADGRLSQIVYPDGTVADYNYDPRGKVTSVSGVITSIDYDLAGRRKRTQFVNGTVSTTAYDDATGRPQLMELSGPAGMLRHTAFATDKVGNVVRIDSPNNKLAATYKYDDLYRLTDATTDSGDAFSYEYDDAGNLTFKSDLGQYHYGENGAPANCLTSAGIQKFTYSEMGEMRSTPWGDQTFNPMGRLTRIEPDGGASRMDFVYDFAGNRVSARSTGGVVPAVDRITPDPLYAIESGVLVIHFFDGVNICARRPVGAAVIFLYADYLGSLVAVTNSGGAVIDELRYDPYGSLVERTGGATPQPVGFTGGTPDPFSKLLYLNARYYSPALGRFVSPDTMVQNIVDPDAWAPYTYCRNNPTTFVDPTGHSFWGIFIAALAIVALIVVVVVCVVLDVFTFGTMTPALAIGIIALGTVVGGVVGGLAANAKGGNTDDIITGILVGAAVGGWAAFASVFAGGAVAGAAHLSGFWGGVVAGAVNGTINGAAIGFASGFAGGKGSLDDILTKMWQGALVGAVTGAVIGGLANVISPPSKSLPQTFGDAYRTPGAPGTGAGAGAGANAAAPPVSNASLLTNPPSYTNDFGQALQTTGTGLLTKGGGAVGGLAFQWFLANLPELAGALAVDAAAGAWDLGYVPWILNKIGVQKYSGKF